MAARRSLLDVEDVLRLIFDELISSIPYKFDQRTGQAERAMAPTLAVIARSCKNLSVHALDHLWRILPDEAPLRRLLDTLGITEYRPNMLPSRVFLSDEFLVSRDWFSRSAAG